MKRTAPPTDPARLLVGTESGFTAEDLAGLLVAGAPPRFCRHLVASFRSRDEWLVSAPGDEPAHLRSAPRFVPPPSVSLVSIVDPEYPESLRLLPSPPPVLFVLGRREIPSVCVGVVGSRQMSSYGEIVATVAASTAVEIGAPVVSGLAAGVDEAAHRVAIDASGRCVGFVGCGFDHLDDRQRSLTDAIVDSGGSVCSEHPPSTPTSTSGLVARNRLIAACSAPLVPAEGNLSSGTMHSVRFAAGLGRPIAVAIAKPSFRHLPSSQLALALAASPSSASARFDPPIEFSNVHPSSPSAANAVCETRDDLANAIKVFWWLHRAV